MKMCRKLKGLPEYRLITRWLFRNSAFAFLALALFSTVFSACASTDQIDASTVEGAYQLAERLEKDERFEEAIIKYTEVKNKHPYSRFALLAELKIADVQFTRESYIEAQYAYQTFKDLHPKHAQIDYVTYRLGLSFFNQLPSTIDRDLSLAEKAILYFDEVTTSYSSSEYSKDAASKKADALKMLAQKEMYIADFYFKKRQFDSALGRYENVLKRYANVDGMAPIALLGAARSAKQTGDRDKVNRFVQMLVSKFPQTSEADKARSELPDVR